MRFTYGLVLAAVATTTASTAFLVPSSPSSLSTGRRYQSTTVDDASATAVIREAPGAGRKPAWENRPGLTPTEFMESDLSKPDLSGMWECPLTRWDYEG